MNKMFSFMAGALCGALIGSVTALLLTPKSGQQLKANAQARIDAVITDARQAREDTERELTLKFEQAKRGQMQIERDI